MLTATYGEIKTLVLTPFGQNKGNKHKMITDAGLNINFTRHYVQKL